MQETHANARNDVVLQSTRMLGFESVTNMFVINKLSKNKTPILKKKKVMLCKIEIKIKCYHLKSHEPIFCS